MTDPAGFDDGAIVRRVVDLHQELRHSPVASRLASVEFGATDAWTAFRYELADLLYDHVWEHLARDVRLRPGPANAPKPVGRLEAALWEGMWGLDLFSGALEKTGALDVLEGAQFAWRSRSRASTSPAGVAIVGFAHQPRLVNAPPFTNKPGAARTVAFELLLHEDNLSGHRRALRAPLPQLTTSESLLQWSDYAKAARNARDVTAIVVSGAGGDPSLSEVFRRFGARAVHRRRFRRLALNAEAARRFVSNSSAGTFVIPDERQPLAQAAASAAKRHSHARVVSIADPVDQLVRKMPYWDAVGADVVTVSNAGAARALGRAGIANGTFRVCSYPGVTELLSAVGAPHRNNVETARQPVVLYCDQGLPGSATRFTELAACLGTPPRAGLIFRPHPLQSAFLLRMVVKGAPVVRHSSIVEAIRSSDVVVTYSSMVTTIAALLERPVILWNPAASPTMPALLAEGVAYWARDRDELTRLIADLVAGRPDHPLRKHQARFRSDLETASFEAGLEAVL